MKGKDSSTPSFGQKTGRFLLTCERLDDPPSEVMDAVVGAPDSQEEVPVVDVMPAWTLSCEGRLADTPPAKGRLLK